MRLLRIVPEHTSFGFMRFRRWSFPFSAFLSVLTMVLFFGVGLNFGIDFKGGTLIEMQARSGQTDIAAVRQTAVPEFLEDLLAFGQGVDALERVVQDGEAGRFAADLPGMAGALVLGVKRGQERCPFHTLARYPLEPGDVVVYLRASADCTAQREPA